MRPRRSRLSDRPRPARGVLRARRTTPSGARPHRGGRDAAPPAAPPRSSDHRSAEAEPASAGGDQGPTSSLTPEAQARQGGGPRDLAHYSCSCGYAFEAHVTTSVHCPHCGDAQAW